MTDIGNNDDYIDVRDIIDRIEELEGEIEAYAEKMSDWQANADNQEELETLAALMHELKGYGGEVQWRGDWYPLTLIRQSYWVKYVQEFLWEIGDLPKDIPPYLEIDWEETANNIRMDYMDVDFDGVTYITRC